LMNRDKKDIIAVTMPGFGTTGKTYNNSLTLMRSIGATVKEIDITKSVLQHFEDIGHDREDYYVTYENSRARMRTMILMDIANKTGGLVVGTGDLSEIALGWSTYNGDHMSMYAVNAGLPKTLIRYLVGAIAQNSAGESARVLKEIFEQEISPELLPPDKAGKIAQKTEDLVGPYELHDYFLYAFVKLGCNPKEIYENACETFDGEYDREIVLKWLKVFFKRFITQQFKRSCAPDGAAIGEITLSKKAFDLPSDLSPDVFLSELENLK
ncbi:MAG: NAD(+) synthase, partial [Clostridia bacterium]|nr:NAD(+) synthase [Clostridia bacterium]